MPKDRIIEELGEPQLLLPSLIDAALDANDRVKYLLTLLQTACAAADGTAGAGSLRDERVACGIDEPELDRVTARSVRADDGRYRIPGAAGLARRAHDETATMLVPLAAAGIAAAQPLTDRLAAVTPLLRAEGDIIAPDDVARLTAARSADDSLHLVVMDAHRELNALAAAIASSSMTQRM